MASSSSASAGHEKYYVPESSSLAIRATIGLILSVFGAALVLNDMTYGNNEGSSNSVWVLTAGLVFLSSRWPVGLALPSAKISRG